MLSKKKKEGIPNAWDLHRARPFPSEDPNVPKFSKRIVLSIHSEATTVFSGKRLQSLSMMTTEGMRTLFPNHEQDFFQLPPTVLELKYSDTKTEKYFTSGGFAFVYFFGPVDLNLFDFYKLDDFDPAELRKEYEKLKEMGKNPKNEGHVLHSQIGIEAYTALAHALQVPLS